MLTQNVQSKHEKVTLVKQNNKNDEKRESAMNNTLEMFSKEHVFWKQAILE